MLKNCTLTFFAPDEVMTKLGEVEEQKKIERQMRVCILRGVNSFFTSIHWNHGFSGLHVGFSWKGCSAQMNETYLSSDSAEALEWKDYCAVHKVLPTIGIHISRAAGSQNDENMTGVHRIYFKTVSKIVLQNYGRRGI